MRAGRQKTGEIERGNAVGPTLTKTTRETLRDWKEGEREGLEHSEELFN